MKGELLTRLPEILFRIGKVIGSDESLASTLSTISELVTELAGAEACSILLVDADQRALFGKAAYGLVRDDISAISFRFGEGVAGWVAEHKESVLLDDATRDERFKFLGDETHIRSLACVPLLSRNETVGVLTITSPKVVSPITGSHPTVLQVPSTLAATPVPSPQAPTRATTRPTPTSNHSRCHPATQSCRATAQPSMPASAPSSTASSRDDRACPSDGALNTWSMPVHSPPARNSGTTASTASSQARRCATSVRGACTSQLSGTWVDVR